MVGRGKQPPHKYSIINNLRSKWRGCCIRQTRLCAAEPRPATALAVPSRYRGTIAIGRLLAGARALGGPAPAPGRPLTTHTRTICPKIRENFWEKLTPFHSKWSAVRSRAVARKRLPLPSSAHPICPKSQDTVSNTASRSLRRSLENVLKSLTRRGRLSGSCGSIAAILLRIVPDCEQVCQQHAGRPHLINARLDVYLNTPAEVSLAVLHHGKAPMNLCIRSSSLMCLRAFYRLPTNDGPIPPKSGTGIGTGLAVTSRFWR